jgi:hypothetical protein
MFEIKLTVITGHTQTSATIITCHSILKTSKRHKGTKICFKLNLLGSSGTLQDQDQKDVIMKMDSVTSGTLKHQQQ